MANVDLHMHSTYSDDGEFSPCELVLKAKQAGIETIALSDHNSVKGVQEAVICGLKNGIEVIPAVELDCTYKGLIFHVLGYFIDCNAKIFLELENDIYQQEIIASKKRIALLNELGIPIDEEEAIAKSKDGVVTGELAAEIALSKTENLSNPLLAPYLPGGSRSDNPYVNFYWDFCAQGKPAYVHINFISMSDAIDLIHNMRGVSVLAHPGNNLKNQPEALFEEIISLGIQGVEVFSSYHTAAQCEYYLKQADKFGIIVTGGSDYHGKTKPSISIGQYGLTTDGLQMLSKLKDSISVKK